MLAIRLSRAAGCGADLGQNGGRYTGGSGSRDSAVAAAAAAATETIEIR